MGYGSFGRMIIVIVIGVLIGVGGANLALASQKNTLSARPAQPQKFTCTNEGMKCTCSGAEDCVGMKNSGQCSGGVTGKGSTGSCTWIGPKPSNGTPLTKPGTGRLALGAAPPPPNPYWCEFNSKGGLKGCACTDVSDCIKLDDSKMCGSNPIKDYNSGGICGNP